MNAESETTAILWHWTAAMAIVVGIAWVVWGLDLVFEWGDSWTCRTSYGKVVNVAAVIAFVGQSALLVSLVLFMRRQSKSRLVFVGVVSAFGFALAGITNGLEHCVVNHMIGGPLADLNLQPWSIGLLLAWIFMILFSLAMVRVRFLSIWVSWLMVAGSILFLSRANEGGVVVFGVAWIVVGVILHLAGSHEGNPTS